MKIMHCALTVMAIFIGNIYASQPWIEIKGLDGAEHWCWFEAENTLGDTSSAVKQLKETYSLSAGSLDPDMVWGKYVSGGSWSTFDIVLPDDFENARLYLRYGCYKLQSGSKIYLDDELVGDYPFSQFDGTSWSIPTVMNQDDSLILGNIDSGEHALKLVHSSSYTEYAYDGFLIYEGDNALLRNSTVTFGKDEWGPFYIQHPGTTDSPDIGIAAKPEIVFHDVDNHEYEIRLYKDGVGPIQLLPGEIIDEPGDYELVVYVAEEGWRMNVYAGANFSISTTGFCGDAAHPIVAEDLNGDCLIGVADLKMFVEEWMECNDPAAPCNYIY